jgi:hypothetical protein
MNDEIPQYELDPDTQALVQTVLELALMSANLQLDHKNSQSVMDIVFTTAFRFNIEFDLIDQRLSESDLPKPADTLQIDNLPFDIQVSFIDNQE